MDYLEEQKRKLIEQFSDTVKKQSYFNWLLEEMKKEKKEAAKLLEFKRKK